MPLSISGFFLFVAQQIAFLPEEKIFVKIRQHAQSGRAFARRAHRGRTRETHRSEWSSCLPFRPSLRRRRHRPYAAVSVCGRASCTITTLGALQRFVHELLSGSDCAGLVQAIQTI